MNVKKAVVGLFLAIVSPIIFILPYVVLSLIFAFDIDEWVGMDALDLIFELYFYILLFASPFLFVFSIILFITGLYLFLRSFK
jgi:hypothetical protein